MGLKLQPNWSPRLRIRRPNHFYSFELGSNWRLVRQSFLIKPFYCGLLLSFLSFLCVVIVRHSSFSSLLLQYLIPLIIHFWSHLTAILAVTPISWHHAWVLYCERPSFQLHSTFSLLYSKWDAFSQSPTGSPSFLSMINLLIDHTELTLFDFLSHDHF